MEQEKKQGEVSVTAEKSRVEEYEQPTIETVSAKIDCQQEELLPVTSDDGISLDLKADLPEVVRLPHRGTMKISCGFSMELPVGFKACIYSHPSVAARGLMVVPTEVTTGPVEVYVVNVGKEIVTVDRGQMIARLSVSPIYGVAFE